MEKTYKPNLDMYAVDTDDDHILHRIGSDDYTEIRHIMTKDPDAWEELTDAEVEAAVKTAEANTEYAAEVERLIRQRYSVSAEFAILRQREAKPDEFATYNAFAEQCKVRAKMNPET